MTPASTTTDGHASARSRSAPSGWDARYQELRSLARRLLLRERADHTLQPTELVHEVYLRFCRDRRFGGALAGDVVAHVARAMRDLLVEHARRKTADKRGGTRRREPLDDVVASYRESSSDLLALDEALDALGQLDPELARLVDLRFFGGLTEDQAARVLGVSSRTARRSWRVARLWLWRRLEGPTDGTQHALGDGQTDR